MRKAEIRLICLVFAVIVAIGIAMGLFSYPDGIQTVLIGFLIGGLYALGALGISFIYGVMGVLNLAHGDLLILGSYITFWLLDLYGIDPLASIFFTTIVLAVVGLALQKLVFKRTMRYGLDSVLLAVFGRMIILEGLKIRGEYQHRILATSSLLSPQVWSYH